MIGDRSQHPIMLKERAGQSTQRRCQMDIAILRREQGSWLEGISCHSRVALDCFYPRQSNEILRSWRGCNAAQPSQTERQKARTVSWWWGEGEWRCSLHFWDSATRMNESVTVNCTSQTLQWELSSWNWCPEVHGVHSQREKLRR